MNEPKTQAEAPAGQPPQWAVEAARQCFPYKTNEAELRATAHLIADCLPAEVAAAVRLVEAIKAQSASVDMENGFKKKVLYYDSGWCVNVMEQAAAPLRKNNYGSDFAAALAALTGGAAGEGSEG